MAGFHDRSLRLLPAVREISEAAVAKIAEVEARIGRPLPAAVRDWYMRKNACAILETYSNQDPPVALDDLGRPITAWRGNGNLHDLAAEGLLYIRSENQGVCGWAVRLDDGDDPAVMVNYGDIADPSEWQLQAETFSDYIYCGIWDFGVALSSEWLLQAQNGPLTEGALDSLRLHFRENVRTHGWPGDAQYRFEGDGHRLLIWSAGGADWFLAADDELSLAEAARKIWRLDDVGKAFWSHKEKSKAALARIAADMAALR
jgi:hypothetical protein